MASAIRAMTIMMLSSGTCGVAVGEDVDDAVGIGDAVVGEVEVVGVWVGDSVGLGVCCGAAVCEGCAFSVIVAVKIAFKPALSCIWQ